MNQQDAVFVSYAAQLFMESLGGNQIAAFTLNGLDNDCSDFFSREHGFKELLIENLEALDIASGRLLRVRAAVAVWVRNVLDGEHRMEAAALNDLAAGERQRSHRAAVESAQ